MRDGEQTPGVALTKEKKLLIARALDEMGVSIIEAGSAITSEGERESIKAVANAGLNAEICSYCRIVKADVDHALECDVDSIHLVAPVSDLHIRTKIKKDRDAVRQIAAEVTEYAKDHGLIVELSGEDASRADPEFLKAIYSDGIDAGADRLCFCDTVGLLVPERATEIFRDLSSSLKAPISIHCHNDFGLATANTVAALAAGAKQAHVTINGLGERAGNASLEEVVMSLEWLYKYDTGIKHEMIYRISRLVSRLTGIPVSPNKALVGGYAARYPANVSDFQRKTPLIKELRYYSLGTKDILQENVTEIGTSVLSANNIRYVIIHKDQLSGEQFEFVNDLLNKTLKTEPDIYAEDELIVYRVPDKTIRPFVLLGEGWNRRENWNGTSTRWISNNAALSIYSDVTENAALKFKACSLHSPKTLEVYNGKTLQSKQVINTNFSTVNIPITLKKGKNIIHLNVPEGTESPCDFPELNNNDTRELSIAIQEVQLIDSPANWSSRELITS